MSEDDREKSVLAELEELRKAEAEKRNMLEYIAQNPDHLTPERQRVEDILGPEKSEGQLREEAEARADRQADIQRMQSSWEDQKALRAEPDPPQPEKERASLMDRAKDLWQQAKEAQAQSRSAESEYANQRNGPEHDREQEQER